MEAKFLKSLRWATLGVTLAASGAAYAADNTLGSPSPETVTPSNPMSMGINLPHVPNNAALTKAESTDYSIVVRDGFGSPGDAPPLAYVPSSSACPVPGGDGGGYISTGDGKCWVAVFWPGPLDARWWGDNYPITMWVAATGNDNDGANYCLDRAHPCLTLTQAQAQVNKFHVRGRSPIINIGPGTFVAALSQNSPLQGAAQNDINDWQYGGANAIHLVGAGSGSTTIISPNNASHCFTLLANYGGAYYLTGLKVIYSGTCNGGSPIYGQAHGKFTFGPDVVLTGSSTNAIMGEEEAFFWVRPGFSTSGLTIDGTFTRSISLSQSLFESDPTVTFNGSYDYVFVGTDGSKIKLAGNPPTAVKEGGSVTGRQFLLSGNSVLLTYHPAALVGSTPGVMQTGAVWDIPPATKITATTGLGTGGSAAFTYSGADPYHGTITLTAGSGAAANGSITLAWPYATGLTCGVFNVGNFASSAGFSLSYPMDTTHPIINWSNGSALDKGSPHYLGYICR
jgi:hypothetical protein